jgi:membrane protease YdiL (CAAX protease family)
MNTSLSATATHTSRHQGAIGFVRRHPLVTFLVIFNVFGQALAFTPVIARSVYGIELDTDLVLIVPTLLFLLLPALVITRIARGPEGLRALLRSMVQFRIPWRWYLLPLLVLPALTLASTLSLPTDGLGGRTVMIAYLTAYLPALLFQFLTTNWWEETAWMGFVQAPLQQRFGPWKAVLLTTPVFALAHISAVFDGTFLQGLVKFLLLIVLVIPIRALPGWVYNRTGSIAFVGLVHAASNASALGLVPALYHQTGDAGIPFLLLAIAAIALSRGRLNAGNRRTATQTSAQQRTLGGSDHDHRPPGTRPLPAEGTSGS